MTFFSSFFCLFCCTLSHLLDKRLDICEQVVLEHDTTGRRVDEVVLGGEGHTLVVVEEEVDEGREVGRGDEERGFLYELCTRGPLLLLCSPHDELFVCLNRGGGEQISKEGERGEERGKRREERGEEVYFGIRMQVVVAQHHYDVIEFFCACVHLTN